MFNELELCMKHTQDSTLNFKLVVKLNAFTFQILYPILCKMKD